MTGQRIGNLTVESRYDISGGNARWLCRCDCGGTSIVQGGHLRNRRTQSCGCRKGRRPNAVRKTERAARGPRGHFAEDITGHRFGRYVVLSKAETRARKAYWSCRCDCGIEKEVCGSHLRRGRVLSCGCLNRELTTDTLVAHNYRGDEITYRSAHSRTQAARGVARLHHCIDCGGRAEDWSLRRTAARLRFEQLGTYTLAYSPDPADYDPRCKPCHAVYDRDGRRDRAGDAPRVDAAQGVDAAAG